MFQGLSTSLTSLYANRLALETTGNNIANVNTEGYSRQRVEQTSAGDPVISFWSSTTNPGRGVNITDIKRLRDQFLDARSLQEHAKQGQLAVNNTAYLSAQQAFSEPGENGLSAQLSTFWASWDDVANNPGDLAARSQVVEQAQTLVSSFQQAGASLDQMTKDATLSIKGHVSQLNAMASSVAELNRTIRTATNSGDSANALLDQRAHLVSQMSDLAGVTVQPAEAGSIAVLLNGYPLVRDDRAIALQVDDTGTPVRLTWDGDKNPKTVTEGVNASISGGRIAGQMDVLNTIVPKFKGMLDAVVRDVVKTVNTQHASGLDQNGNPGGPFFVGTDTATFAVGAALANDSSLVAAAAAGGGPLDGENARTMADLATALAGPDASYRKLIDILGVEGQRAERQATIQQGITNSVDASKESVAGVNLDEEMANMVRFQKAYDASAKYLTVMNDVLGTLLGIIR